MSFLIPAAYAQEAAAGPAGTGFEWVFLVGFLVIFYLMIWRPRPSGPRNTRTWSPACRRATKWSPPAASPARSPRSLTISW